MFQAIYVTLARWLHYRSTLTALRRLDRTVLADLGLGDHDLRAVARRASETGAPVSLYCLIGADAGAPTRTDRQHTTGPEQSPCADRVLSPQYCPA